MTPPPDAHLREVLAETAESLVNRHLHTAQEWFPHTFVPWTTAQDFAEDYEWSPDEMGVPAEVRSALFVNTLTEDNLPYYFRDIERMFGRDGAWGEWVRRWTAEEGRHGLAMNAYLMATRSIDPVELERGRMAQVSTGEVPEPPTLAEGLAYVSLQELATRISHFNTGNLLEEPTGKAMLRRIAKDENLHYLFYRDAMTAIFEHDPSTAVMAVEKQVRDFQMPGTGILGFTAHAKAIADAGIYDFAIHHDKILKPVVLRDWGVESLEGLTPEAEEARASLVKQIARIGKIGHRMAEKREARKAAAAEREPVPA
ncbi:MAG: acyl-ACP desaturase [Actinomycetota bacterium]